MAPGLHQPVRESVRSCIRKRATEFLERCRVSSAPRQSGPRGKRWDAGVQPNAKRAARPSSGFSLIELLIVVAIILVIAAIAIPNFLRSRIAANEAAAVSSLRAITSASVAYSATYGNGYPPTLQALGGPGNPATCNQSSLIDPVIATAPSIKSGYQFAYAMGNALPVATPGCGAPGGNSYTVQANPTTPDVTGQRYFFVDESGIIRRNLAAPAGPLDQPI